MQLFTCNSMQTSHFFTLNYNYIRRYAVIYRKLETIFTFLNPISGGVIHIIIPLFLKLWRFIHCHYYLPYCKLYIPLPLRTLHITIIYVCTPTTSTTTTAWPPLTDTPDLKHRHLCLPVWLTNYYLCVGGVWATKYNNNI